MDQQVNQEHEAFRSQFAEDEINLVDLFLIIWNRKIMIVVVTLLMVIAAAGVSIVMPKIYSVSAMLEPGKDTESKPFVNSQTIRETILGGAYDKNIAEKLGIPIVEIPTLNVSVPKQTDLVKISIESSEPQQAVLVLQSLVANVSKTIDEQLGIKRKLLDSELKTAMVEANTFPKQIQSLEELIQQVKLKIAGLESSRKNSVTTSAADAVTILLYLNEIQNQQVFLSNMQKDLAGLRSEKEKKLILISDIRLQLAGMKGVNVYKQASISDKPIKPKKTLIVALAAILGFMGGIMLAFFAEFLNKVRLQQLESEGGN